MADRATGRVDRIYSRAERTSIRLDNADIRPKDGYYVLEQTHPNYHSLYALALTAAINRYPLLIRATGEITANEAATVDYMVVDW